MFAGDAKRTCALTVSGASETQGRVHEEIESNDLNLRRDQESSASIVAMEIAVERHGVRNVDEDLYTSTGNLGSQFFCLGRGVN